MSEAHKHSDAKPTTKLLTVVLLGVAIALFSGVYLPHTQGHPQASLIGLAVMAAVGVFFCFAILLAGPHRHGG